MIKKLAKISSIFIVVIALFFISITSVFASSSTIKNIDETISVFYAGDLEFSDVSYKNWVDSSINSFGLTGLVYNGYEYDCIFNSTATFYDLNRNIVATTYSSQIVPTGDYNSYSQLSDISEIDSDYTADDIAYYKLEVEVVSNNEVVDNKAVKSKEALTVRLELPEGYFSEAIDNSVGPSISLLFIIPIIFAIISYLLWKKYGKDDQTIETVEFYPPEGFNSLEVGYLYKGEASSQEVVSLLIYLANKGYIKIGEIDEGKLSSNNKVFKITKLKEYDGNNINERIFFKDLFTKKPVYTDIVSMMKSIKNVNTEETISESELSEVISTDLYDNFYMTMARILSNINNKDNKNKIFEKLASGKKIFLILMIIITFCLITIPPMVEFGDPSLIIFKLLFPGIGFSIMLSMFLDNISTVTVNGKPTNSPIVSKIFGLLFGVLFGGMPWTFIVLPILLEEKIYLYGYIVGIICMIICFKYLPKRTPYENQMLGKIRGFKNFLEAAEKEKLESLVMQNPEYFYDIYTIYLCFRCLG